MKLNGYTGTIETLDSWLYRDGKTEYAILLPENASEAERFAGRELTAIFEKAGVQIETVTDAGMTADPEKKYIAIGNTVYFAALGMKMTQKEFKFDGFIIERLGKTHIIRGVNHTGTTFGVYGFAEYVMGYRYYYWDEWKVEAQAKDKELHIKDIPTFFCRAAFSYDTEKYTDHAHRLRITGQAIPKETWHGEGTPWSVLEDQSFALQLMDVTKYRAAHPDWYYLNPDHEGWPIPQGLPQICYSKALLPDSEGGFFDTFMENLINDYIAKEKDQCFFMLGTSDNHDICNCPDCQKAIEKYTYSGLNMLFVNKVADAVEAWRLENCPDRDIYLVTFAYITTQEPPVFWQDGKPVPTDPEVIARDNVIVRWAPIYADYRYSLLDETHNADSRRSLLGWAAATKRFGVWDYRSDFNTPLFPYPFSVTAQTNHNIYLEYGMMDVFNQAQHFNGGPLFQQMDDFARARMHWNGKENYAELTEEFRKAYYKEAEPFVTEYLHLLENSYDLWASRGWTGKCHNRGLLYKHYYRLEEILEHKAILDKALATAETQVVYDRVNALTVFYKMVLICNFTLELPKEEMLELIRFMRSARRYDMGLFCRWSKNGVRRYLQYTEYLDEAEKVALGKLKENERTLVYMGEDGKAMYQ